MRRNKQLIKLVYNNVKNFTHILISCNCVQIVSSKKALSVRITFNMLCCNSTKRLHADEQGTYYLCLQRCVEVNVYFDLIQGYEELKVYFDQCVFDKSFISSRHSH